MPRTALRDRKREFVRAEASAAILKLVIERGFENITVDDMAAAAGLARRTFFRYFESKEDALFVGVDAFGEAIAAAIERQPVDHGVWDAIRDGVLECVKGSPDAPELKRLSQLLYQSPALRTRHLDKHDRWRLLLAANIARRLRGRRAQHRAELLAAVALAALDAANMEWHHSRTKLATLVSQAFEDARPARIEE